MTMLSLFYKIWPSGSLDLRNMPSSQFNHIQIWIEVRIGIDERWPISIVQVKCQVQSKRPYWTIPTIISIYSIPPLFQHPASNVPEPHPRKRQHTLKWTHQASTKLVHVCEVCMWTCLTSTSCPNLLFPERPLLPSQTAWRGDLNHAAKAARACDINVSKFPPWSC